jgi:hypothetical protein
VARGAIDREEWAKVVQELLDIEAAPLVEGGKPRIHGAKTRFAVKAGMRTARTVDTWLAQQVDVKEASVEAVAEAYGLNPMDLLIRVGRYAADDLSFQCSGRVRLSVRMLLSFMTTSAWSVPSCRVRRLLRLCGFWL